MLGTRWVFMVAGIALVTSCIPVSRPVRDVHEPASIANLVPPLQLHMSDGSLYEAQSWQALSAGDTYLGITGQLLDRNRALVGSGDFAVPLDSIVLLETYRTETRHPFGLSLLTGMTVFWGAITIACVSDPKSCFGSCPTFYVPEMSEERPVAEGFSSSIARSLEATDIDAIHLAVDGGATFALEMRNEAFETHAVRSVQLVAVPRTGGRSLATADGAYFAALEEYAPSSCRSAAGDCLPDLTSAHGYAPLTDSTDLATRDTMVLQFPAEAAPNAIAVTARQKFVSTFLIYEAMDYMGRDMGSWLAGLERNDPAAHAAYEALASLTGVMELRVRSGIGPWRDLGSFDETGPIAGDELLFPLPDLSPGPLQLMVVTARGSWRIEHVSAVVVTPAAAPTVLDPHEVEFSGEHEAGSILRDTGRYLITQPGDRVRMVYMVPKDAERYDLFVRSRGYYYEWMRAEWIEPDSERLALLMAQPRLALREMAPRFKQLEPGFETQFWNSRFTR
ncbi:MAG: hypothetical protein ACE5FJ_01290 [Gemmatimonadales bacterium]